MVENDSDSNLGTLLANDSVQQKLESDTLHSNTQKIAEAEDRFFQHSKDRRSVLVRQVRARQVCCDYI